MTALEQGSSDITENTLSSILWNKKMAVRIPIK